MSANSSSFCIRNFKPLTIICGGSPICPSCVGPVVNPKYRVSRDASQQITFQPYEEGQTRTQQIQRVA